MPRHRGGSQAAFQNRRLQINILQCTSGRHFGQANGIDEVCFSASPSPGLTRKQVFWFHLKSADGVNKMTKRINGRNKVLIWLAAPVACVLLLTLWYWAAIGRYARKVETADLIGTWVSDDSPDATFTFRGDGTSTLKNIPTGLFDGAYAYFRPPYINKPGHWHVEQPYVGDRVGSLQFSFQDGGGEMSIADDKGSLSLFFYVGDPDSNKTVDFH